MMKNDLTMLPTSFFDAPALDVAPRLLGKFLIIQHDEITTALLINEVEAYDGIDDRACHARHGKTPRNAPLFGEPGRFYVYFIYGMYWMLNIVVGPGNHPAALLIRGAGIYDGPGKLTRFLGIDNRFNGRCATRETGLWFEDRGVIIPPQDIIRTPRIGVDYAGPEWSQKPYRFITSLR